MSRGPTPTETTPATDLLEWAAGFALPHSSEGQPRKVRFSAATLPAPGECHTDRIRGQPGWRRPNGAAIVIDCGHLTTDREGFRALGLVLLAYALSEQKAPLRIHLPPAEGDLGQIVVWPGAYTRLEGMLGCRIGVREVLYRPKLIEGNPNYSTVEQDDDDFPREHLPYCTLGAPGWVNGGPPMLPGEPACLHFAGTSPSLVWMGRFLLNLSLSDSNCRLSYLYNTIPSESLAAGSAELRLMLSEPAADFADVPADTDQKE